MLDAPIQSLGVHSVPLRILLPDGRRAELGVAIGAAAGGDTDGGGGEGGQGG